MKKDEIPEEILKQIATRALAFSREYSPYTAQQLVLQGTFTQGAEFGYSLAGRSKGQESEEALKQEIEAWKTAHKEASEHFMEMAADYTKCEKEMEAKDRRIKELEDGLMEWQKQNKELREQINKRCDESLKDQERISELTEALRELIEIKRMKDSQGKTDDYLQRQPIAWLNAFQVVYKKQNNF